MAIQGSTDAGRPLGSSDGDQRRVAGDCPAVADRDRHSYVFSFRVDEELPIPIGDRFPGNGTSTLFEVPNMTVNWGFDRISRVTERKMTVALHGRSTCS